MARTLGTPQVQGALGCARPAQGAGSEGAYRDTSSQVFLSRWMELLCRAERMA